MKWLVSDSSTEPKKKPLKINLNFLLHVALKRVSCFWRNIVIVGAEIFLHVKKLSNVYEELDCNSGASRTSMFSKTCHPTSGWINLFFFSLEQKCIFSEGQWFTPPEFERFGMKERHKKWKTSILCKGIPLQKLIEVHKTGFNNSFN